MHGLIRACQGSGELDGLRGRILYELGKLVPYDAAFMATSDPETLLFTSAFADEALRPAGPLFLDNEFGDTPDVNRFADLAEARTPVRSLDDATRGDRRTSPRSSEIMAPLGLGDEARVALRLDGTTWGFLCLHRSGPLGFAEEELALLGRVAPHLGEAIRRTVVNAESGDTADPADQGLIMVVEDHVAAMGGTADYWLEQMEGFQVAIGAPLPLPMRAVVRRLQELERSGPTNLPAVIRLATRTGMLLTLHALRLHDAGGTGPIALAIGPAGTAERTSMLLASHGLTPAQRRVAQLVLRGRTTRQMMLELHISEYTVQDHLKAIFDKVGVRSRRDLVSTVMKPPTS
jgi:DNA-binding CsgD family transcriptional regulator